MLLMSLVLVSSDRNNFIRRTGQAPCNVSDNLINLFAEQDKHLSKVNTTTQIVVQARLMLLRLLYLLKVTNPHFFFPPEFVTLEGFYCSSFETSMILGQCLLRQ